MSAEIERVTSELREECAQQIANPLLVNGEPDLYIAKYASALSIGLEGSEHARERISKAVLDKRNMTPFPSNVAFNSLLRLFQMKHMSDEEYPYEDSYRWLEEVQDDFSNPDVVWETAGNIIIWNIGSDVETRIAGPKLIALTLLSERTDDKEKPFKVLNVGSARDHGLAMLTGALPMPEVEIDSSIEEARSCFYQRTVNKLLAKELELGDCYGVDVWPLRDPSWSDFLEACRFYPIELKDQEKRQRYKLLEEIRDNDPRLHHTDADFAKIDGPPDSNNGFLEGIKSTDKYDMVIFSTCLYQNYPEAQRKMFDNAVMRLSQGGIIVVQDFCTENENPETSHPIDAVSFMGSRPEPYTYTTLVFDTNKPEDGLVPFAYWNNGRCEALRPAPLLQRTLDAII